MDYNFFALISRLKNIDRWSLMRCSNKENVMEHTEQVTVIAHALAVIKNKFYGGNLNIEKVMLYALYHETGEVITGDLPTPVKYDNRDIINAYKQLEHTACERILKTLPAELKEDFEPLVLPDESCEEYITVKCADKIAAYIKCLEEIKMGNGEFKKAKASIEREIKNKKREEVDYFMQNFIPAFSKTLDELDY